MDDNVMSQAGGAATVTGVMYQTLWCLLRAAKLYLGKEEATSSFSLEDDIASTLLLEPKGGGGDVRIIGQKEISFEQLKADSNAGTWSLRSIILEVIPDLFMGAHECTEGDCCFRLVTESPAYADARKENEGLIKQGLSPFKLEVAKFLLEKAEKTEEPTKKQAPLDIRKDLKSSFDDFLNTGQVQRRARPTPVARTIPELIKLEGMEQALSMVNQLPPENVLMADLGEFLSEYLEKNPNALIDTGGTKTELKRLIKIYDWMKYRQKKRAARRRL